MEHFVVKLLILHKCFFESALNKESLCKYQSSNELLEMILCLIFFMGA